MKRLWIILFLIPACLHAEDLPLSSAVDRAQAANHALLAQKHHVEYLQMQKKEAFTNYLPRIDLSASYTRLNAPIELSLDPLRQLLISLETQNKLADFDLQTTLSRGYALSDAEKAVYETAFNSALSAAIPSMDMHLLDQDVWRATLQFIQPIWMGGKIKALNRGAELNVQEGVEDLLMSRETVMEETCRIYLMNKLLDEVVSVNEQAEKGIAGHLKQAESLYNSGLIAKYQLLRAKVAYSEAEKNLKNAEDDRKTARSVLANLINSDNPDALVLTTPLPYQPSARTHADVRSEIAENNPTLRIIDIKKTLVKTRKKADIADDLPQFFAFGRYELYKGDLSFMDPDWAVGVGVKFNVFSSGEKLYKLKADDRLYEEAVEKRKDVEDLLRQAGDQLYWRADSRKNTVDSFAARLEEARENLKLAESRFSSGLGISLEVVDAHLVLQKIQTERLQAVYEYDLSWLKIHELSNSIGSYLKELEAVR